MNNELYQLCLSLKIGDGCYVSQSSTTKNFHMSTRSINKDYLDYKRNIFTKNDILTKDIVCPSGYKKGSIIYGFSTRVEPIISVVGNMSKIEILDSLDILGLILYYLDDGSLHKNKHFMHLYCNSFNSLEVEKLIEILYNFFPQKRCPVRYDKKKDGRVFPYIYIPVCVAKEFSKLVYDFLVRNNINSLLYKTISPSQTIENIG